MPRKNILPSTARELHLFECKCGYNIKGHKYRVEALERMHKKTKPECNYETIKLTDITPLNKSDINQYNKNIANSIKEVEKPIYQLLI
jgi:hypothetical protein